MRPTLAAFFGLVLAAVVMVPVPARAQWAVNGVNVCAAAQMQLTPLAVVDGAGGAFIVWVDRRTGTGNSPGDRDLYAQHIDASGTMVAGWLTDGIAICDATGDQVNPAVASDGAGGLFVAWQDHRDLDDDLYLTHVLPNGTLASGWPVNGRLIGSAAGSQQSPCMAADESGGIFLAWSDSRSGNFDIRALHLDANGNVLTAPGTAPGFRATGPVVGNLICGAIGDQTLPRAVYGGSNSAIVVWQDARGANSDIYGMRVLSTGLADLNWTADGVLLSDATAGTDVLPRLVTDDEKGAIVAWCTTDLVRIHAQHLTAQGQTGWTPAASVGLTSSANFNLPLAPDGSSGVFLGYYSTGSLYVQHLDASGVIVAGWPSFGIAFYPGSVTDLGSLLEDGGGGLFLCYGPNADRLVQHITGSGTVVAGLPALGQSIRSVPLLGTRAATMVADGAGGFIVAWEDERPGTDTFGRSRDDIYAQRVLPNGLTGMYVGRLNGVADVPLDQGGWVALSVSAPPADVQAISAGVTGYNVWRLVTGPQAAPQDAADVSPGALSALIDRSLREPVVLRGAQSTSAGFPPGTWQSLGFTAATQSPTYSLLEPTRNDSTGAGLASETYLVTIHTTSPAQYYVTAAASGHSSDNLPPAVPQNVAGARVGPGSVNLTWSANTEGDLAGYSLYRGADALFVPSPGNRVGSPATPGFVDAGFVPGDFYKLAARDRHGNESAYAVIGGPQILAVEGVEATVDFLAPPAPSPFTNAAVVTFGLARAQHVSVTVLDLAGRRVRTLLDAEKAAGTYHEPWSGEDSAGNPLPPGIYLVRLRTGGVDRVRRVVRVE